MALLLVPGLLDGPAFGQGLPEDFIGRWVGSGILEDEDSLFFGMNQRDLDVVIEPVEDGGFFIDWITIIRQGDDGQDQAVRRRETRLTLFPTERDRVFRSDDSGDAAAGGISSWARVSEDGQTFVIYQMIVSAGGTPEMARYERTLTEEGMDLLFTRFSDGEAVRAVRGRLTRAEDADAESDTGGG